MPYEVTFSTRLAGAKSRTTFGYLTLKLRTDSCSLAKMLLTPRGTRQVIEAPTTNTIRVHQEAKLPNENVTSLPRL